MADSNHPGTQPDDIKPQGDSSGLDADTVDGSNASELGSGVPASVIWGGY